MDMVKYRKVSVIYATFSAKAVNLVDNKDLASPGRALNPDL
jgi:hypothetical protein